MSKYAQTLYRIQLAKRLKKIHNLLNQYRKKPTSIPEIKQQSRKEAEIEKKKLEKLSVVGGVTREGEVKIFLKPRRWIRPPIGKITTKGFFKPFELLKVEGKKYPYYSVKEGYWFRYVPKPPYQFPLWKRKPSERKRFRPPKLG